MKKHQTFRMVEIGSKARAEAMSMTHDNVESILSRFGCWFDLTGIELADVPVYKNRSSSVIEVRATGSWFVLLVFC